MVVLKELADIMKGNTNQADNLRIAFKAFDSEGADLVRILDKGAEGFDELAKKGNQMFGVFSSANVEALSQAKTSLESLGRSATIVSGKLIDLFGIDDLMNDFAQLFMGQPVTDATDMFKKMFNPAKPQAFFDLVDKRLKDSIFGIDDFDAKELFDEEDLKRISEQILKISGTIRDVIRIGERGGSAFTKEERENIAKLKAELIEIQKLQGKSAVQAKIQEAIQARIAEFNEQQNRIVTGKHLLDPEI